MDVRAVRQAVADAITTAGITVNGNPLTAFSYVPADGPTPFLYVTLEDIKFDKTFSRGTDEIVLTLMVMCSISDDRSGQEQLDALLSGSGPSSIKAAMESARGPAGSPALGGVADDVYVDGLDGNPRWFDWSDGKKYYGVGLKCRVIGPGA